MIGKLRGRLDSADEDGLILDVGGVGYLVAASARTLRGLPGVGEAVTLHIETQVRALGILGALPGEALAQAISRQDKAMMARAPGVGPKLAARLVLELKDKAPAFAGTAEAGVPEPATLPKAAEDAALALTGLGYGRPQAAAAVAKAMKTLGAEAATAALIRAGLKELAQ